MPRHLISDAHEWINEIPTVPIYYLANPHRPVERPSSRARDLAASDSGQLDFPSRPRPPGPQSHSFSRSYGTILPTSLIYIILVGQRLLTLET